MESILAYLMFCFDMPIATPVCQPMWIWAMLGALAFAAVMLTMIIWQLVSYRLKVKAAFEAEARRQAVDYDAIRERKWPGEEVKLDLNADGSVQFQYSPGGVSIRGSEFKEVK